MLDLELLTRLATAIRVLAIDSVEKANSGHPGMPMGAADYAAVLWSQYLRFNPQDPGWADRDRFVLSAGHGSMLLYSLLHLFGFDLPLEELINFRQWDSKTPGHPEFGLTPGVETTTGPLGQGFSNGVGMALSGKLLSQTYSAELFKHRVFGIISDGDLMEGVASEAASLAGHLRLSNIIYFYDDNEISIGGSTDVCFTESVPARFEAYGWHVQSIDGHNMLAAQDALDRALAQVERPSLICAKTTIGFGSPHKAGNAEVHGAPLGKEEAAQTKKALGWSSDEQFFVPPEVRKFCAERVAQKKAEYAAWSERKAAWATADAAKAELLAAQQERRIAPQLKDALITEFREAKKDATRSSSGRALQVIARHVPFLIGGSADLEPSTKTLIKGSAEIQAGKFSGRNIRFGVREHAMGAIVNGLAYSRAWIPYSATFLVFADYMRPAIRLAAISHLQSLFIFTHDSFWVGEDGPTHQPVEHIECLRAIPNLFVFRPADELETALCYYVALQRKNGPSALLFTRQNVPPLKRRGDFSPDEVLRGAYIVSGAEHEKLVIVATGSEVWLAHEAAEQLARKNIAARVISMPCVEGYLNLDGKTQASLVPRAAKVVAIEAGTTLGWRGRFGADALVLGVDRYGASAPGETVAAKFGFEPAAVAAKIESWLRNHS